MAGLSCTYFQVFPRQPRIRHRHGISWLPKPVSRLLVCRFLVDYVDSVLRKGNMIPVQMGLPTGCTWLGSLAWSQLVSV